MLNVLRNTLLRTYHQYEMVTCVYMFEPWERKLINSIVVLIFFLVLFSSYMYLPAYIAILLRFISPTDSKATGIPPYASVLLKTENSVS